MSKTQKARIYNVLIILLLSSIGIYSLIYAVSNNLNYYLTPTELIHNKPNLNLRLRLGGVVKPETVMINNNNPTQLKFILTDELGAEVKINYNGILPDLFAENKMAIVYGKYNAENNCFYAEQVVARHNEVYKCDK